jgi:peroxiredoxin Q/BCP
MALQVGDTVPHFSAIDSNGYPFEVKDYLGQPMVIYFYPKDDTPGCTVQACTFRDKYENFKMLGTEVIGISSDNLASHQKFVSKYKLPFILLSDTDKKIRKEFGVPNDYLGLIPGRATYVIDKKGIVQFIFDSISAKIHIEKALEIIKTM